MPLTPEERRQAEWDALMFWLADVLPAGAICFNAALHPELRHPHVMAPGDGWHPSHGTHAG